MKTTIIVDKTQIPNMKLGDQHGLAMNNKRKNHLQFTKIKSLVVFLLLSLYPTSAVLASDAAESLRMRVTTDEVKLYQHTQELEVPGVWVAKNEITVSSPHQAIRIKKIYVDEGDVVKAGQLLAELEETSLKTKVISTEGLLAQVNAKIGEIKVRKREAESMYSRSRKLKATNAISSQQLDELSATAQSFHHQLLAAEAEAKQVEQQLIEARSQLDKSQIRSPVDGIISKRFVHEGELVNLAQLFRLISHNQIEFEAMVTQNLLSQLHQNMPAKVSTHQNTMVDAKVRLIGTSIQKETGIATIRIKPNKPIMVSSGTAGKATFQFQNTPQVAVDTRALRYEGISPYVFVVNDQACVETRSVELGPRYLNQVIVHTGLKEGDKVVLSSSAFLKNGDCITLKSPNEQSDDDWHNNEDEAPSDNVTTPKSISPTVDDMDIYDDAAPLKTETKPTQAQKNTQPVVSSPAPKAVEQNDDKVKQQPEDSSASSLDNIENYEDSDNPYDW